MSKVRFRLSLKGLNELMKSEEMQTILTEHGQRVMENANSNAHYKNAKYGMDTKTIRWIAVTTVRADNATAVSDNMKNNTLLKALH